jgi:hypothetical protein
MLPSAVVGRFPLRVDDWSISNFDDAVARHKGHLPCGIYQFDVRPLVAVMVNIISDLAK